MTSTVTFGKAFKMATALSSSRACAGSTSALASGKRTDVSSMTRTPTLRGTAGLMTTKSSTWSCPGLAFANARVRSRSLAASSGTTPLRVIPDSPNSARTGTGVPSGSVSYVATAAVVVVGGGVGGTVDADPEAAPAWDAGDEDVAGVTDVDDGRVPDTDVGVRRAVPAAVTFGGAVEGAGVTVWSVFEVAGSRTTSNQAV